MIRDASRFHAARPPGNGGYADAALVQIPLDAPKRSVRIEIFRIASPFAVRPVVAGEEHKRIFGNAVLLKAIQQTAYVGVHSGNHGRRALLGVRPVHLLVASVVGHFHAPRARLVVGVGNRQGEIQHKRPFPVPVDEGQRRICDKVVAVGDLVEGFAGAVSAPWFGHSVARHRYAVLVMEKKFGIVIMRVPLSEVAEKIIETLPVRVARRVRTAQPPFAHKRRPVSGFLQHLGEGHDRIGERLLSVGQYFLVSPDVRMPCVPPVHEYAARRSAHGRTGIELRKPEAFRRHAVQPGRSDAGLSVRAYVCVAEVVRQNEDQVRRRGFGGGLGVLARLAASGQAPCRQAQRKRQGRAPSCASKQFVSHERRDFVQRILPIRIPV